MQRMRRVQPVQRTQRTQRMRHGPPRFPGLPGLLVLFGLLVPGGCSPATGAGGEGVAERGAGAGAQVPADARDPAVDTAHAPIDARTPADTTHLPGETRIVFLHVGQGDAVLIRAADGRAVLYDGGTGGIPLLPLLGAMDIRLEMVIASHNHADHIGGLAEVIAELRPRFVMENGVPHTTRAYENMLVAIARSGAQLLDASPRTVTLGDVQLHVIPPPGRVGWGHNDNSIGVIVEVGDFRASLLGDSEGRQQEWWLANHRERLGRVSVHKASHHGSSNGDIPAMIAALRPEAVVVSARAGNSYGHPHAEALGLYDAVGATVHRTDLHGTIRVRVQPDGSWTVEREGQAPPVDARAPPGQACVDINRAPERELVRIIHIGPDRARQIVRLRAERPFTRVEELVRVRGIAAARLRDIVAQGVACVAHRGVRAGPGARGGAVGGGIPGTTGGRHAIIGPRRHRRVRGRLCRVLRRPLRLDPDRRHPGPDDLGVLRSPHPARRHRPDHFAASSQQVAALEGDRAVDGFDPSRLERLRVLARVHPGFQDRQDLRGGDLVRARLRAPEPPEVERHALRVGDEDRHVPAVRARLGLGGVHRGAGLVEGECLAGFGRGGEEQEAAHQGGSDAEGASGHGSALWGAGRRKRFG
jgi:competence protein ComEC